MADKPETPGELQLLRAVANAAVGHVRSVYAPLPPTHPLSRALDALQAHYRVPAIDEPGDEKALRVLLRRCLNRLEMPGNLVTSPAEEAELIAEVRTAVGEPVDLSTLPRQRAPMRIWLTTGGSAFATLHGTLEDSEAEHNSEMVFMGWVPVLSEKP